MEKTDHPYKQDPLSERQQCAECGKALIQHPPKVTRVQGTIKPTKTGSLK